MTWPIAFTLTLLSELPLVMLLTPAQNRVRILPWFLIANGTSHPALWGCWSTVLTYFGDYHTTLLVTEAVVFTYESAVYSAVLRSPRGILVAVGANTASMLLGLLIAWLSG